MRTQMMDRVGDISGKVTMTAGAASAVWGWVTVERVFSLIGVLCGVAGLLITWYYKRKADARHAAETALRLEERRLRVQMLREHHWPAERMDSEIGKLEADE